MSTYNSKKIDNKRKQTPKSQHRLIYAKHYGPIPKDENGFSYDIHHIDGNHLNNNIDNLQAVSIQEHYDIHMSQGDYGAASLIKKRIKATTKKSECIWCGHEDFIMNIQYKHNHNCSLVNDIFNMF